MKTGYDICQEKDVELEVPDGVPLQSEKEGPVPDSGGMAAGCVRLHGSRFRGKITR